MAPIPTVLAALWALAAVVPGQITGTYAGNDIEGLRAAVEEAPENAGLRLRLSQALLRRDTASAHPDVAAERLAGAQEQFRSVLVLAPRSAVPLRVLALDGYRRRRFEESVAMGRRLLDVVPHDDQVARTVLKGLIRLDRKEEAAAFCTGWLASGTTTSFGAVQGLLSTLVLDDAFRDALGAAFDRAVATRPGDVELRLYYAMYLLETGRTESAWEAAHAAEARGLCDTRTGSRHAFCRILASRAPEFEDAPGAVKASDPEVLAALREEHPDHAGLAMRHARLLDLAGRTKEALAAYADVRRLNPAYWPAFYRAGQLLMEGERLAEAAAVLEEAREAVPEHLPIRLAEAEARIRAGDPGRGMTLLGNGAGDHAPGPRTRGLVDLLGERDAADGLATALREAVEADPGNPYLLAHLALALHAAGDVSEAREAALAAERAGLTGQDGWPARVLYDVFGVEPPAATRDG